MAPIGRKRKAAPAETVDKREKLAEGPAVVIEHCQALQLEVPELPVQVNPSKPRRGSFEVTLLRADNSRAELWTGIKKGPPRKLKFPEPQEVVKELKKYLS
ncbi:Selenoprotein H [Microtus ochrogaster]|uniref:Selenoprotein H n=1 Tax=Microtus ochrogaster TaxID=79684 RepID=A0A8J6GDP9_MICOH|nr:Selenoprotein H [Microtus ochrogaster]